MHKYKRMGRKVEVITRNERRTSPECAAPDIFTEKSPQLTKKKRKDHMCLTFPESLDKAGQGRWLVQPSFRRKIHIIL